MQVKNKEPWQKVSICLPLTIIFNPNQLLEPTHGVTLQVVLSAWLRNEGTKQVRRAAKNPYACRQQWQCCETMTTVSQYHTYSGRHLNFYTEIVFKPLLYPTKPKINTQIFFP